jgi:hypothetical protein
MRLQRRNCKTEGRKLYDAAHWTSLSVHVSPGKDIVVSCFMLRRERQKLGALVYEVRRTSSTKNDMMRAGTGRDTLDIAA